MFDDRFGLTQAVLSRRKTQTRRIVPDNTPLGNWSDTVRNSRYQVGEIVAVAQSYRDAGYSPDKIFYRSIPEVGGYKKELASELRGWANKMFVGASLMPHYIRITDVRVERLQDISDKDCVAEGVRAVEVSNNWGNSVTHTEYRVVYLDKYRREKLLIGMTPREVYAVLIDRIFSKGTWERNPFVFIYDFELLEGGYDVAYEKPIIYKTNLPNRMCKR